METGRLGLSLSLRYCLTTEWQFSWEKNISNIRAYNNDEPLHARSSPELERTKWLLICFSKAFFFSTNSTLSFKTPTKFFFSDRAPLSNYFIFVDSLLLVFKHGKMFVFYYRRNLFPILKNLSIFLPLSFFNQWNLGKRAI